MLAIKNGGIIAWGSNSDGQVTIPAAAFTTNGTATNKVVAVSAGYRNSLALTSAGTVVGWGHGYDVAQINHHYPGLVLIGINSLVGSGSLKVIGIAAGGDNTANGGTLGHTITGMVLLSDGTIQMFGDSMINALNEASSDIPIGLKNVVAISLGGQFALALKSDGTVTAWGSNSKGQTNVPTGLNGVVAISAGGSHALALKSDGTVVAWGDNSTGQSTVPGGLFGITAVEAGSYFSMSSTQGVGDSQTSGGGGQGGGGGGGGPRPTPTPRSTPISRGGTGGGGGSGGGSTRTSSSTSSGRSAPAPRTAPSGR